MSSSPLRVDASFIPLETSPDTRHGLRARFHSDGQLESLECWLFGLRTGPSLRLLHGVEAGVLNSNDAYGCSDVYNDGASESFDPWSDNSRPVKTDFAKWVRTAIERVLAAWDAAGTLPEVFLWTWHLPPAQLKAKLKATKDDWLRPTGTGHTLFSIAAARDDGEVFRIILERFGLKPPVRNEELDTAVRAALEADAPATLRALSALGFDLKSELAWRRNRVAPLNLALDLQAFKCVDALLEVDGLVSAAAAVRNPLFNPGSAEVARKLLAAGADVNGPDSNGRTPLLLALGWQSGSGRAFLDPGTFDVSWRSEQTGLIEFLLEAGADVDAPGAYDGGPLHIAASAPGPQLLQLLLPRARRIDTANKQGRTPLAEARAWKRTPNVELLEVELRRRGLPVR